MKIRAACFALLFVFALHIIAAEPVELTILYTNDIHAQMHPLQTTWKTAETRMGGFAHIATKVEQIRNEREHVLFLSAGDVMTGPPVSRLTKGEAVFDLMNVMGYDAMCLGNHEFDQGWQNVLERVYQARFPVLGANIFYRDTNIPFAMPCAILQRGPLKIGIIGILGRKAALETINTRLVTALEFRDQITLLQEWVPRLRPYVDVLILLAHEGVAGMQSTTAEQDRQRRLDTDIAVASAVPGIDVLITGHAHRGVEIPIVVEPTGTLLVSTYGMGTRLGELVLQVDPDAGDITGQTGKLVPVLSEEIPPKPDVAERIAYWDQQVQSITNEVLGHTNHALTRDYYDASPLGNLCADAFRAAAGTEIAITNSGGLRADVPAGPITAGQILAAYPFENPIVRMTLSGEQVFRLLEHGATFDYGIVQVSGIRIKMDTARPKGDRILWVTINGNKLDRKRAYSVATSDYMARGGDAYTVFAEAEDSQPVGAFCTEAIMNFIRTKGIIRPESVDRILVLNP